MPRPTETALKGRARALLEAMSERGRWIYAVPQDRAAAVPAVLEADGFVCEERDDGAHVARYARGPSAPAGERPAGHPPTAPTGRGTSSGFVVFDSAELEVTLVEARGDDAPATLARVLERTGFYAQSQLIGTALDVRDPEAPKALRTLAHMVVVWDEDWGDLFLLHLASPDPVVRHDAVAALCVAAMVAQDVAPAVALLREAHSREKFPKLAETMREALGVLAAASGGPVEADPDRAS